MWVSQLGQPVICAHMHATIMIKNWHIPVIQSCRLISCRRVEPVAVKQVSCGAEGTNTEPGPALSPKGVAVPEASLPLAVILGSCRSECKDTESEPALSPKALKSHIPLAKVKKVPSLSSVSSPSYLVPVG